MKLRNTKTGETITIKGDWEIIPDESDGTPHIEPPPYHPFPPGWPTTPEYPTYPTIPMPPTWEPGKITCLHLACPECHGTGRKQDGSMCIHHIACSCPRCTPQFSVTPCIDNMGIANG